MKRSPGVGIQKAVNFFVVHRVYSGLLSLGNGGGFVHRLAIGLCCAAGFVVKKTVHLLGPAGSLFIDGVVGGHKISSLYKFAGRTSKTTTGWLVYLFIIFN